MVWQAIPTSNYDTSDYLRYTFTIQVYNGVSGTFSTVEDENNNDVTAVKVVSCATAALSPIKDFTMNNNKTNWHIPSDAVYRFRMQVETFADASCTLSTTNTTCCPNMVLMLTVGWKTHEAGVMPTFQGGNQHSDSES